MHRLLLVLFLFSCNACWAQEFYFLGGVTRDIASDEHSYAWMLEYQQAWSEHTAVSIAWLNEGHVPGHHRDGLSVQFWGHIDLVPQHLSIAAGIGPYSYFDTAIAETGGSYSDDHGWGSITSVAANWNTSDRWQIQLRAQHIETDTDFDSTQILLGVGYRLMPVNSAESLRTTTWEDNIRRPNEFTLFFGYTIVNSDESEHDLAVAVEYRHHLSAHTDWTVGWLDEGDPQTIRRDGLITQIWLVNNFEDNRLGLGVGLGPYIAVDTRRQTSSNEDGDDTVAALVSLTASYRFQTRWLGRILWNRVATNYSRDTDVLLVGMGYRF